MQSLQRGNEETSLKKCVLIVDGHLPIGLAANTAAVLAMSLGRLHPELIGADLFDQDGQMHPGITTTVLPILKSQPEQLVDIARRVRELPSGEVLMIDVTTTAQQSKTYEEYQSALSTSSTTDLTYIGLCLFGHAPRIKSLTGSLALLR